MIASPESPMAYLLKEVIGNSRLLGELTEAQRHQQSALTAITSRLSLAEEEIRQMKTTPPSLPSHDDSHHDLTGILTTSTVKTVWRRFGPKALRWGIGKAFEVVTYYIPPLLFALWALATEHFWSLMHMLGQILRLSLRPLLG